MAITVRVTLKLTGEPLKRVSDRMVNLRALHQTVGVLMMSRGLQRLVRQVKPGQLRTPGLRQALQVGGVAGGTIFRVGANSVVVGSNLPHARITQEGGTILPKTGKALAIPQRDALVRNEIWPRDFPRGALTLIKPKRKRGGLIGWLVDKTGSLGFGKGILYTLVAKVRREPKPFLFFDAQDERDIEQMTIDYLDGK